jgi:hypothetical protein
MLELVRKDAAAIAPAYLLNGAGLQKHPHHAYSTAGSNNQAERDARQAKTQQKISGRLRSETTTRHRYAVRGYASTAAKHGHAVFTAIRDALAGNPWIPPVPADA